MSVSDSVFASPLIDAIRNDGACMKFADGRVLHLPETFGFCTGVMRAVSKLVQTVQNGEERQIWLLGAMIHNPAVNMMFIRQGVKIADFSNLDMAFEGFSPDDIFVIPAFGLPLEIDERLRNFASSEQCIVDATCPFVRRVWEEVEKAGKMGNAVIIHGKFGHQETNAIWSRAVKSSRACALLTTPAEAEAFAKSPHNIKDACVHNATLLPEMQWTLLNQTTMLSTETEQMADILEHATWHKAAVKLAGTLCPATRKRQQAAAQLCDAGCGCIIVLGGTDSSNTTQLYRMAVERLGREKCFFVHDADDIGELSVRHYDPIAHEWQESSNAIFWETEHIGVLTGASCPDSELEKLVKRIAMDIRK